MSLKVTSYSLTIRENNKQILENANLELEPGTVTVILGENGTGKSSFAMSLLGFEDYERSGSVMINGVETIGMETFEIARLGLFVSFQSPPEFEGINFEQFLINAYKAFNQDATTSIFKIRKSIKEKIEKIGLSEEFLKRDLNQGFSGGEKRKAEILQMLVLQPKIAILDEVDSGLDIKSRARIAEVIREQAKAGTTFLIVSHSLEFVKTLEPNRIVELRDKKFYDIDISEIEKLHYHHNKKS